MMTLLIVTLLGLSMLPLQGPDPRRARHSGWHSAPQNHDGTSPCAQPAGEQSSLIRKAQKNKYLIRRVEFIGNENTRDGVLRRRIWLQEGDPFTRAMLIKSLTNVSRIKLIYPVRLSDVLVQLNGQEKTVDLVICFKEKVALRVDTDRLRLMTAS